ncbi:MAG TPA: deoxyribodipyrimidine photo-lyase, partial [Acidobacteriota bacterium]|nr:deoxyribodipyrimidine photo-lyase [Acidobacteriota bacterium]
PYKGDKLIQFMLESISDLQSQIASVGGVLNLSYGITHDVVGKLIEQEGIDAVFSNKDYTPFAKLRDAAIADVCKKHNVAFFTFDDSLLFAPGQICKDDGKPYTVFTPFYRRAMLQDVKLPQKFNLDACALSKKTFASHDGKLLKTLAPSKKYSLFVNGGRTQGFVALEKAKSLSHYDFDRDFPAIQKTTGLSAHNKFGTLSIREVHQQLSQTFGADAAIVKQLYWRDFLTHISIHFPHVYGHAFDTKYEHIAWIWDEKKFLAWCEGKTGFPIVDAGMRQLVSTGFMHNRVRMIVASFLTKDLHIDWRIGEKFFAQHLIDYDPAVNNGNWQWASSTGCDAQPYFRIFNPWLQQEKFDKDAVYIKQWITELKDLSSKEIHALHKTRPAHLSYPTQIVEHADAKETALMLFHEAKR